MVDLTDIKIVKKIWLHNNNISNIIYTIKYIFAKRCFVDF